MGNKNKTASWYQIKAQANQNDPVEVLIYDEIGYWGVSAQDFVSEFNQIDADEIHIRINSPGGSVFEGMAIYNAIRRHKAKITTFIDGLAASMASIIALAGDEVHMAQNAYFMIHNPWGFTYGEASDMRKYADRLDDMREQLANVYQAKTDMDRAAILQAMDDETWYSGDAAKENGFVDILTETLDIAASYRGTDAASRFNKSPIRITALTEKEPVAEIEPPSQQQPETPSRLIAAKLDLLKAQDGL